VQCTPGINQLLTDSSADWQHSISLRKMTASAVHTHTCAFIQNVVIRVCKDVCLQSQTQRLDHLNLQQDSSTSPS